MLCLYCVNLHSLSCLCLCLCVCVCVCGSTTRDALRPPACRMIYYVVTTWLRQPVCTDDSGDDCGVFTALNLLMMCVSLRNKALQSSTQPLCLPKTGLALLDYHNGSRAGMIVRRAEIAIVARSAPIPRPAMCNAHS